MKHKLTFALVYGFGYSYYFYDFIIFILCSVTKIEKMWEITAFSAQVFKTFMTLSSFGYFILLFNINSHIWSNRLPCDLLVLRFRWISVSLFVGIFPCRTPKFQALLTGLRSKISNLFFFWLLYILEGS